MKLVGRVEAITLIILIVCFKYNKIYNFKTFLNEKSGE